MEEAVGVGMVGFISPSKGWRTGKCWGEWREKAEFLVFLKTHYLKCVGELIVLLKILCNEMPGKLIYVDSSAPLITRG